MFQLPRRLVRLSVILVGLLLIGLAVLHLPSVRRRVLERARSYAAQELGITLQASNLRYGLLSRSIELRDVSASSTSSRLAPGDSGLGTTAAAAEPFLEAERVRVELGSAIFLGRVNVTRISLTRPRLTLVRHADGTLNLPPSRDGGEESTPLRLGVVSLTGLSVRLDDRVAGRSFAAGPFDLSVDTRGPPGSPGAFGPGVFAARAGEIALSGTIAGQLAFDGTRIKVDALTVETRAGRLAVAGWADVIGRQPAISARVTATVDLNEAARVARVDGRSLAGRLDVTADVDGTLDAPRIAVAVAGRDLVYPPIGPIRLAGRSSFSGSRALLDTLDLESGAGALHAQGAIELGDARPPGDGPLSRLAIRWSDLDVDALARAFGQQLPVQSGAIANGSATVDFDARHPARAVTRSRALAATTFQAGGRTRSRENLALSGDANLRLDQGSWSLPHSLRVGRGQLDLAGTLTGRLQEGASAPSSTIGGRSRVRVSDLAAVLPLMKDAGIMPPPDIADGLAGSMLATVDLAGTLANPRARIALAGRDLRARVLPSAASVDALLDLDTSGVRVGQLHATAGSSALTGSGRYSWRGMFDAHLALDQHDLSQIAEQFHIGAKVSGAARLEGAVSGRVTKSARTGQASLTLSANAVEVEDVVVGAVAADAVVALENGGPITVRATAPDIGARAQLAIVNRTGYPVSGQIALEHDRIDALIPLRYRGQVGDLSGEVSATANGSGLLSDPAGIRGRIDLRAFDVTLRGTRVALAAPGSITVTEDRFALDSIDLRIGEATRATLTGQLGVTELSPSLQVRLDGPLSELLQIGSRASGTPPVAIRGDGKATLDLAVRGTIGRPLPVGTLMVSSPSITYGALAPVTRLTLDAVIDPALITLRSAAADWQGMLLAAEGIVPWRVLLTSTQPSSGPSHPESSVTRWLNGLPAEPARARLTVRASNATEAVLRGILDPQQLGEIQANVSATIVAEADRLSLERIDATAVLAPASLTLAGVPFTQRVPTRLRLEKGRARIEDFQWAAEGNVIVASGGADLTGVRPSIDLGVAGAIDLRVLSAFVSGIESGGSARANLRITGLLEKPDVVGEVGVADAELQMDSPRLAATDLHGTLLVGDGRRATVSLTGFVNTGRARLEGTLDLADISAPAGNLQFTGRGIAFEYPAGLQTESDADLALALGANPMLSGRIEVQGGTYREPLVLSSRLLNLSSASGIAVSAPSSDWLTQLRLNVAVTTVTDVRIDNNYGRLDAGADLRLVGTAARPGVLGRLQAADDGEIYLGGNTYRIERLTIDLTNPRAIAPEVNFSAQTRIGALPIGIELRCPAAGPCERKVTSLATGIDDEEAEAQLFGTSGGAVSAGESLARLLSGELLGVVGRTVGLDAIRLEQQAERRDIFEDPTLISGDVDPAARLTLAKRLGSDVELVFSQNLADDGFTWIASYFGPFGLSWRLLVLDDQSRSYEFRHEPPLGGARPRQRARPPAPRIAAVRITGTPGVDESELRKQLRLGEGDRFTFANWQRDRDRLERFYQSRGFFEARIRARRPVADTARPAGSAPPPAADAVVLEYTITRGPATQLIVQGSELPGDVRTRIADRWSSALFDGFLERDARAIVRDHFYRKGYLQAAITAVIVLDTSKELKTLTVGIAPGSITPGRLEVTGNEGLTPAQLLEVIDAADPLAPWLDQAAVERLLENHYRSEGFLAADVSLASPEVRGDTSVVAIRVAEGAAYSIGDVVLSGVPVDLEKDARDSLALTNGGRYQPEAVAAGVDRLEARLRRAAYREASAEIETRVDPTAARVDMTVRVSAGARSILRDVVVEGADATKVASSIALTTDAPLDPADIRETRQRLYDLDVYRSVDIQVQPVASAAPSPPGAALLEQPVSAKIILAERPRYRLRYGLAVSDEEIGPDQRDRRLGVAADLENRNLFGRGVTAGVSLRLRRDQKVGRFTLGARRLFGVPIRSTLFVERQREQLNPEGASPITSDVTALSAEQAYRIRRAIEVRYGYRIERNHTFIRDSGPDPFDLTVTIGRLTTGGLVDRRDDPFNPARGWFTSSTLELSRPNIGSDLSFLKDFSQYSHFVPLGRGLVLASAARLGLARTFDDEVLIPSERFFAGGANTVRGYREDDLGARSIFDDAEGGSALLVLNGELRFPVYRWLRGVGFVDVGNVYPKLSDISLGDLQIGVGAGARFDTPFGLIRFDLGIPANRRSFDPRWRIHVGLGHAF